MQLSFTVLQSKSHHLYTMYMYVAKLYVFNANMHAMISVLLHNLPIKITVVLVKSYCYL